MGRPHYTLRTRYFFFQAEDGIRDTSVTGVQTCALPISWLSRRLPHGIDRCGRYADRMDDARDRTARRHPRDLSGPRHLPGASRRLRLRGGEIGRASCRERVELWGVAVVVEKDNATEHEE